jgi:hypothetical protein
VLRDTCIFTRKGETRAISIGMLLVLGVVFVVRGIGDLG